MKGEKMKVPLDKVIEKIVALGVPGLVLVIVVAAVGPAGGAAIVTALAVLGSPFGMGMWAGLAVLGLLVLIANAIAEYGVEAVAKRVIKGLEEKGLSKKEILDKVERYPISKGLKLTLKDLLS